VTSRKNRIAVKSSQQEMSKEKQELAQLRVGGSADFTPKWPSVSVFLSRHWSPVTALRRFDWQGTEKQYVGFVGGKGQSSS
jgi:hypothetical protein